MHLEEPQQTAARIRRLMTNRPHTFTVTVTDTYGRFVSGLNKSAFTVLDEKKPQEITYFSDDDSPVSVGVIFDVSGSMSGDKVRRARDALSKFIQTSHDSDEYFLIAFNSRAQLLLDKTRDGDAILNLEEGRQVTVARKSRLRACCSVTTCPPTTTRSSSRA